MQESKAIKSEHTVLLPYTQGVCGFFTPCTLEIRFEFEEYDDEVSLRVVELTGIDPSGRKYDMIYMIEDGDGEGLDKTIMTCILGNKSNWDNESRWW